MKKNLKGSMMILTRPCRCAKTEKRQMSWEIGTQKLGIRDQFPRQASFGLGERNERGDRFIQWCEDNHLVISNTWFQNRKSRLYTSTSPGDRTKNQIDHICVNQRFKNAVPDCKAFPGADVGSDHAPVVAKFLVRFKKLTVKRTTKKKNYSYLSDQTKLDMENLAGRLWKAETLFSSEGRNIESAHEEFKRACKEVEEKYVPTQKRPRNSWITDEITNLMAERQRKQKHSEDYKELDKLITNKCIEAKAEYFDQQCDEIEALEKYMPRDHHKRIQLVTGKNRGNKQASVLKDKQGNILIDNNDILSRWREYIGELYEDESRTCESIKFEGTLTGEKIMRDEIRYAIKGMKQNKAAGRDEVPTELIKCLGETGIGMLHHLADEIYEFGEWPKEMMESTFIPLPKKPKATDCSNFRTISIMNHSTKIILRVIMNRMRQIIHEEVSEMQFGFMPDKGTRNAIYVIKRMQERNKEMQKIFYFIDYTKAFDRVEHNILFEILNDFDFADKDIRVLQSLYFRQQANVRVNNELSDYTDLKRGVRQGCIASPDLFSLYTEMIMRHSDDEPGVNMGGHNINNIRFADDTGLIAGSQEDLQNLLNVINERSEKFGMKINTAKTEVMIMNNWDKEKAEIMLNGVTLKQVEKFKYLGRWITSDGSCSTDIKCRIAEAKTAFTEMRSILSNLKMPFKLRYRILNCYVIPIMMYGCENWILMKSDIKKVEAAEMWFLRRMQKISWKEKKSNEEIVKSTIGSRNLLAKLMQRQTSYSKF